MNPTQHTQSVTKREPPSTQAEAMTLLPADVLAVITRLREEQVECATWVADGLAYAAAYGIKGGHLALLEASMLATGWGRYSPSVLVWGWGQTTPSVTR